nr:MAG TPA: ATP-binding sugar transporter [Caudoviricetes sp.]
MSKSYDLSTSTKWANLADGDHVVKLRAKGAGYGSSSFSNSVTVKKGVVAMPVKGDLITIESKQYRVLKITDTIAEVLSMYDATDSQVFGSSNNTYAGSALDTYCNSTFYGTLSNAMQNAIIAKTFQQDSWTSTAATGLAKYNGTYGTANNYSVSLISRSYGESITKKCYTLSCQDVIDYLEVTTSMSSSNTTLTSENIWKMFWNQTTVTEASSIWLYSASSDVSSSVYFIRFYDGSLRSGNIELDFAVRPVFQIDLPKVSWHK